MAEKTQLIRVPGLGFLGKHVATPPTPPAGYAELFVNTADGKYYYKMGNGTLIGPLEGPGGGASNRMLLGIYDSATGAITSGDTFYTVPIPGGSLPGTTVTNEDRHSALCPFASGGTFRRLYAHLYNNLSGANGNLEIALRINGADTALKIIATPQDFGVSGGPGTILSNLTDAPSISAGQRFNVVLRNLATNLTYTISSYWLELQGA